MKKILVLLLVLAVAGGVFAQEWSLSGGARVGAKVDFDSDLPQANIVKGTGDYDTHGGLDAVYDRGDGLTVKLGFGVDAGDSGSIGATVHYDGDNYALEVAAPIKFLLLSGVFVGDPAGPNDAKGNATVGGSQWLRGIGSIDKLWGYYNLLGGMVHLEGAFKGRDNEWWKSNDTAGTVGANLNGSAGLLTNVNIGGLDFGILVPWFFGIKDKPLVRDPDPSPDGTPGALLSSIVGFKFVMEPIQVAAQFGFQDYQVYFGLKWTVVPDVLSVGGSFHGIMKNSALAVAGVKVDYSQDVFGAAIAAKFGLKPKPTMLDIEPSFWYKVLPETFYFKTTFGFTFYGKKDEAGTDIDYGITWRISPEISWNFLQDGAKPYDKLATGMGVKFNLVSKNTKKDPSDTGTSNLQVGFKWSF